MFFPGGGEKHVWYGIVLDVRPFGGPGRHRDAGQVVRQPWDEVGKLLIPRIEGGDLLDQGIAELPAPEPEELAGEGQKEQYESVRVYRDEFEVHVREQQAEGEQKDHRIVLILSEKLEVVWKNLNLKFKMWRL